MATHSDYSEEELIQEFRNGLYNIDQSGKRKKIYPTKPKGDLTNKRAVVAWILLAFLFAAPHVRISGHPLMLLNLLERKFIILGIPFHPQDLHLLLLSGLFVVISVILATAIVGRVWCGWACPQTIFLEFIFRRIEYLIEGSALQQLRNDQAPMSTPKLVRKVIKHAIFYAISFAIANTFLAYIIGSEALFAIITDPPSEHIGGLAAISIFSFVFYAVFARFREQACIIVCPYGRFQSVLVDENSKAVTYDFVRGEPRGKLKRSAEINGAGDKKGDCIDCGACVRACPTGIDIRNGIQLECVNCTACIDACDDVMDKVEKPRGLIRYASLNEVKTGAPGKLFTTRVKAYTAVWLVVLTGALTAFSLRDDTETIVLRVPGSIYQKAGTDAVVNLYNVKMANKTYGTKNVEFRLLAPATGTLKTIGDFRNVPGFGVTEGRLLVTLPLSAAPSAKNNITVGVFESGKQIETIKTGFLAPDPSQR